MTIQSIPTRFQTTRAAGPNSHNLHSVTLPSVARYAVIGPSVPPLTQAVPVAEHIRRIAMGCSRKANELAGRTATASVVFSGKHADGSPLRHSRSHQHAHFLCEAAMGSATMTHLTVFAPLGFDAVDEIALTRLAHARTAKTSDWQLVLLGIGHPQDFGGTNEKAGASTILASSRHWISRTPFVLNRHLKLKRAEQHNAAALRRELERAVAYELQSRSLCGAENSVKIEWQAADDSRQKTPNSIPADRPNWNTFQRRRTMGGGHRAGSAGFGFRLQFDAPVSGPIALGYGCHYGLGQFIPE